MVLDCGTSNSTLPSVGSIWKTLIILCSQSTHMSNVDQFIWRWNTDGVFTVKSYYNFLNLGGTRPFYKIIWQNIFPLKVKIHIWLLLGNRLLTGETPSETHCK